MGILEGFWFWVGKQLAEIAAAVGLLIAFVLLNLWLEYRERKHRARRDGDSQP